MTILRSLLATLIALAIVLSPIGSAMVDFSAVSSKAMTAASQSPDNAAGHDRQAMDMADCDPAMHGSRKDCPCCDTKGVCPPELCPLKIFKVFDFKVEPVLWRDVASAILRSAATDTPPEWRTQPQPPPPRA